ncbi:CaiB/BaiF CoA transferase family protein [Massilia sp. PWRC2]|uniref:CaiB/BaiF CoA transferase family protein n=1 Tax=Massilia sp. PWRC2 TaxID=2804626 RepID=UPI003CEF3596
MVIAAGRQPPPGPTRGPLAGLRVIEMVGLGPCPFAAMLLADMGAEVIRIDRLASTSATTTATYPMLGSAFDVLARSRRSLALDLKVPAGQQVLRQLLEQADVVVEGFRPGVMERLGVGPAPCLARNARLVYGRVTGWGQSGPLAQAAGHDLNYIALSGMLAAIGRADAAPPPPLNLVGDFGGGGMLLAFGVLCAVLEAKSSGHGQVVDAAMTEGSALLGAMVYGMRAFGNWRLERGANLLDGGAPFYDSYACADGKYITIAALEPQFYAELLALTGAADSAFEDQCQQWREPPHGAIGWPVMRAHFTRLFASRSRAQWCALLEGTDVCFAPVLDMDEAPLHPHNVARASFIELAGVTQPAPAPRFSRSVPAASTAPRAAGADSAAILTDWGFDAAAVADLRTAGVI